MTRHSHDNLRKLPQDVKMVSLGDVDGWPLYGLRFAGRPPPGRPPASHDQGLLTQRAWQIHRTHRPSVIDDARLQEVVRAPPLSPARLLGELMALQCGGWMISSTIELLNRATDIKLQDGDPATNEVTSMLKRYKARSWMSLYLLEGAFEARGGSVAQGAPAPHAYVTDAAAGADVKAHVLA